MKEWHARRAEEKTVVYNAVVNTVIYSSSDARLVVIAKGVAPLGKNMEVVAIVA